MSDSTAEPSSHPAVAQVSSHDRILSAGKKLFARNGYENTSTVAIAREAGTSESQLMKHFGSKQGLLSAILDRGWSRIVDRIQALNGSANATARLISVLEAMVIVLQNDPELKELMTLESCRVRKDGRDVLMSRGYKQFSETVTGLLTELQRSGKLAPYVNLDALRSALIGMAEGMLRDQVVASRSDFRAEYGFDDIRMLLEAVVPALGPELKAAVS